MPRQPKSPKEILRDAERMERRDDLKDHLVTIELLRAKNYTYREIASFLNDRGVETDHTKLFRFTKGQGQMPSTLDRERFVVPEGRDYEEALRALAADDRLSEKHLAMLRFHFDARNRTASFRKIGEPVGYDHNTAKLQYGHLGKLICEAIGMEFARLFTDDPNSEAFRSSAIGNGSHYADEAGEFQLVMHHELAKALEKLGWFKD